MFNKWISRGDNDRVSAPKLICHNFPKFCVPLFAACFAEGFNYQGWGHGFDFFSFFLQVSPRLVEAAIQELKKYRIWQHFCLGKFQYLDVKVQKQ